MYRTRRKKIRECSIIYQTKVSAEYLGSYKAVLELMFLPQKFLASRPPHFIEYDALTLCWLEATARHLVSAISKAPIQTSS